jgi:GrpB-like predicted nucleotidyltransferase (UPF0157 family)
MLRIEPYDEAWPEMFSAEARVLRLALGGLALRVEHVGSTSVPGLSAKPVIDIQVSVPSLEPLIKYIEMLERSGYGHVSLGDFDRVYPFFTKPVEWPSTHHVHLCVAGGEQERKHLAFRNFLRAHPDTASSYVSLKKRLAAENDGATLESRERYSLAKTEFVNRALRLAGFNPAGAA